MADRPHVPNPSPEFFGVEQARKQQYREFAQLQLRRFEDSVVAYILRRYRLSHLRKALADQASNETQSSLLLVRHFEEMVESFPLHFETRLLPKIVERAPLHAIWNGFSLLPFAKSFDEILLESTARRDVKPPVLLFNWPYLRVRDATSSGPGVVVHACQDLEPMLGSRVVYHGKDGEFRSLEPLLTFLGAVDATFGTGWKADYTPDAGEA